jgi:hypothetical protein
MLHRNTAKATLISPWMSARLLHCGSLRTYGRRRFCAAWARRRRHSQIAGRKDDFAGRC